ncbi:MAG: BamA/TamA family outer membrane protein [Bacteroidia bacterium]
MLIGHKREGIDYCRLAINYLRTSAAATSSSWMILLLAILLSACNPTRFVPQNRLLIKSDPIVKGAKSISTEGIIKTKANRRILIPKAYLSLYNLGTSLKVDSSSIKKVIKKGEKRGRFFDGVSDWLRNSIGEPPMLVSQEKLKQDSLNLLNAYASNGFFDASVDYQIDTIIGLTRRRKANVSFIVKEGKPFYIKRVFIDIQDEGAANMYRSFFNKSLTKAGKRMSYNDMATERVRIANAMRDNGYFTFSPRLINFEIDTTGQEAARLDSTGRFRLLDEVASDDSSKKWMDLILRMDTPPERYRIREIFVDIKDPNVTTTVGFTDQIRLRGPELDKERREAYGLTEAKLSSNTELTFLVSPSLLGRMQFNFIAERIFLEENSLYNQSRARQSLTRLQELAMLQYAIINYDVIDSLGLIDVMVEMQLSPQYQFKAGFEAYNNNFNGSNFSPVIGASFGIRNKNTFGRAELLDISVSGDVGLYPINENLQGFFWQVNGKADLTVPRFLLPFPKKWLPKTYRNLSRYRPNTTISLSVLNQQLQQFDQFETGLNLTYGWFNRRESQQERTQLSFRVDITDINIKDEVFAEEVANLPDASRRAFVPRFSSPLALTYTNSDFGTTRLRNTSFFQLKLETGGHLQRLLENFFKADSSGSDNLLQFSETGNPLAFGQYIKASVENKYQLPINAKSMLVLRGLVGGSIPIGKTIITPPESRFYAGGTSGMRGWLSRTLGPGTFPLTEIQDPDAAVNLSSLFALGGELIFEANAEYRLEVWEYIEIALFSDLGNVWFHNGPGVTDALGDSENQSTFRSSNLALGWDAGFGVRLDFDFLIIRLDVAQQLFAPDLVNDEVRKGWVVRGLKDLGGERMQFNLGIGYPF